MKRVLTAVIVGWLAAALTHLVVNFDPQPVSPSKPTIQQQRRERAERQTVEYFQKNPEARREALHSLLGN